MNDLPIKIPNQYESIVAASKEIAFSMPSDLQTGSLLRTLIASKPGGRILELGTGTGLSLAWIVESMDSKSSVISIDNEPEYIAIAAKHFQEDPRVELLCGDGAEWIKSNDTEQFDLIFADAWPGKYNTLDETLSLVSLGGFYVIDDMRTQPNWPEGHEDKALKLINYLDTRSDFQLTQLNWSTGVIIMTKIK